MNQECRRSKTNRVGIENCCLGKLGKVCTGKNCVGIVPNASDINQGVERFSLLFYALD